MSYFIDDIFAWNRIGKGEFSKNIMEEDGLINSSKVKDADTSEDVFNYEAVTSVGENYGEESVKGFCEEETGSGDDFF